MNDPKMIPTTAIQHLFLEPSARWAASECFTTYPPHWVPAMVRAQRPAFPVRPQPTPPTFSRFGSTLLTIVAVLCFVGSSFAASSDLTASGTMAHLSADGSIPAYRARFDRLRPVIAIIGENSGTELTDFAIPYGVLARSGVAEVLTVSTQPGVLRMRPALKVQPDASIADFDVRFPQGADYVIVPAVVKFNDPTLVAWVKAQGLKGGTLVSICDGAAVVASTGLMNGHRATAHWASAGTRHRLFPHVNWIDDIRYVADGEIISTAGISAALPASLALVEAIAGHERALGLARELGTSDWSIDHRTAPFRPKFGVNLKALISVTYTNAWFHPTDMIGLHIANGIDEIALAVTADAYSRTGRSMLHALSTSSEPVRTRSGLMIMPDTITDDHPMGRVLPDLDATPSAQWLAKSIEGISQLYGPTTAYGVALNFEYPMVPQRSAAKPVEVQ